MKKKRIIVSPKSEKKREKIAAWLGIFVLIIGIITFALDLPQKLKKVAPQSTRFYGFVIDETGQPVGDAVITVTELEGDKDRIGFDKTKPNGYFNLVVKEKPEATVWVTVSKDGHIGFQNYKSLMSNTKILFKKEK